MLRVTIELVPLGDNTKARVIHKIYIGNMGGDAERARYSAWVDVDPRAFTLNRRPDPDYRLKSFERDRGAIALLGEILRS